MQFQFPRPRRWAARLLTLAAPALVLAACDRPTNPAEPGADALAARSRGRARSLSRPRLYDARTTARALATDDPSTPRVDRVLALERAAVASLIGLEGDLLRFRLSDERGAGPWTVRIAWGDGTVSTPTVNRLGTLTFLHRTAFTEDVSIDFEGLEELTDVTETYADRGVTFGNASILTSGFSLNPAFPPRSGVNLIFDFFDPAITATFETPVSRAGAYTTGNDVVRLSCYDEGGTLLGTTQTPGQNSNEGSPVAPPNLPLFVTAQGISSCTFEAVGAGFGNNFTLDDFTYRPASAEGPRTYTVNVTVTNDDGSTSVPQSVELTVP